MSQYSRQSAIPWQYLRHKFPERRDLANLSYQDAAEAGYVPQLLPSRPFAIPAAVGKNLNGTHRLPPDQRQELHANLCRYREELADYQYHVATKGKGKLPDKEPFWK